MDYTGKLINKNPPQPTQASASGVWTLDEAAAAVKNNSWPIPGVPNPISKSLRFNSADSAYLTRTPGSAGNRRTWTWSGWVKRSKFGSKQWLFSARSTTSPYFNIGFAEGTDESRIRVVGDTTSTTDVQTSALYRDISAWYHIVVAVDTTQATASDRVKIYVNGSQVTAFASASYPGQNNDTNVNAIVQHNISGQWNYGEYLDGYLTEINFIDGQALTPSSFGQTNANTGVWEPKPYTGTYGGNGFYLNFKDSATTTALGYDYSGNGNNWTPNNFSVTAGAGNDSLVDVPTQWIGYNTSGDTGGIWRGNYCTLNPLNNPANSTLTNGNLDVTTASSTGGRVVGTVGVSSGKWYWEITPTSVAGQSLIGIAAASRVSSGGVGDFSDDYAYQNNGNKYSNSVGASYGASYVANDVIGVALDLDAGTLVFYKNNSSQGTAYSSISGTFVPAMSDGQNANSSAFVCNFGQRPFAYTPPAGFLSLCTTNLPTPTIGATATTRADDYFNTVLYTGTGSSLSVTGVGFQPDFVWIKERAGAADHGLYDAVRGVQKQLESNTTDAETTETTGLTAFNSDGFTVGALAQLNTNTDTYVSWNWKANGAGSSNTQGSITSTVSANTTSGFSIVTYTGNGTSGATVGHGCLVNGAATAPSMIIIKNRTDSSESFWAVYHKSAFVSGADPNVLYLNSTQAQTDDTNVWGTSPAFTSTTFKLGDYNGSNGNGDSLVAYCFAPVAGYSAFGSYTGNGSTDGVFVYTGFRPRYILVKSSSNAYQWSVHDTARQTYNEDERILSPNSSSAEDTNAAYGVDVLSNGFKWRNSGEAFNFSGYTYIYAAFAESPFKYALAR